MIPLMYVLTSLILGLVFPRVEARLFPQLVSPMSTAAAMSICSSVASGMISLTGIVFSLTFVMIQFSASAYSPRLVLWVARDPVLSHALGMFTATFLYALTFLAWVDRGALGRVPFVSGSLVVILLLGSMGMFIALIERIGLLQVNRMLTFTAAQGRRAIEELYAAGNPTAGVQGLACGDKTGVRREPLNTSRLKPELHALASSADFRSMKPTQSLLHAGPPRRIQAVQIGRLMKLAVECDGVIEVTAAVGNSVLEKTPILRMYAPSGEVPAAALAQAVELGHERTFEQDPKYAIRLVVDIALKALSPAINDPTTAVQALDQIEDLLLRLGGCQLDIGRYHDPSGKLRVVVPFPTWEDFLLLALDEIRFCGAHSVQVMRRLHALLKNLTELLPVKRHPALQHWRQRLGDTVTRSFADADEKKEALVADQQGLGLGEEEKPIRTSALVPN